MTERAEYIEDQALCAGSRKVIRVGEVSLPMMDQGDRRVSA